MVRRPPDEERRKETSAAGRRCRGGRLSSPEGDPPMGTQLASTVYLLDRCTGCSRSHVGTNAGAGCEPPRFHRQGSPPPAQPLCTFHVAPRNLEPGTWRTSLAREALRAPRATRLPMRRSSTP